MFFVKATKEDIEQLTNMRLTYLTEDNGKLNENELRIIKKDLPDYFIRNLNQGIFGYVAKEGEDIVSCALLLVVEKPVSPAFLTGKTGTVLNVYTKPDYRNRGYARKLMDMLLADAAEMGLSVVELKATDSGYKLYKSVGFEDAESKYHAMKWKPATSDS